MRLRYLAVAAALGWFGCAPTHYVYAPVRTMSAELGGATAAIYDVPPGSPRGDVRVAMMGIATLRPGALEDSTLRAVHVALAASNRSDDHWTIEPSEQRLVLATGDDRGEIFATTVDVKRPSSVDVPPRSTRYVELYFPVPFRLQRESALPSFDVIWTVHAGAIVVTQRTPFQRFLMVPPTSSEADERDGNGLLPRSEAPLRRFMRPLEDDD